jgi:hypothetical protein
MQAKPKALLSGQIRQFGQDVHKKPAIAADILLISEPYALKSALAFVSSVHARRGGFRRGLGF